MSEVIQRKRDKAKSMENKKKTKKRIIIAVIIIAVVIAAIVFFVSRFTNSRGMLPNQAQYVTENPSFRSIIATLDGSGALNPADSYTVTSLVKGEILSADFEEGDTVEKDTVLYTIDSGDVSNNIERTQISLDQAKRNYEKAEDNRYIRSSIAGSLYEIKVREGDNVNAGQQIAVIRDTSSMRLVVPFSYDDALRFYIGQDAEITLDGSFETLFAKVTEVSGSDIVGIGNRITRNVTLTVENPGALTTSQYASAKIDGVSSVGSGKFQYNAEAVINSTVSGSVLKINTHEGESVKKDQIIVTLGGENLDDSLKNASDNLKNAEFSMDSSQKQLDNYIIKSPISGTVVDKQYKAGDNAETGRPLCTIYDLGYLEMTIQIDELDISKVGVGQKVTVTADAVEGRMYEGIITKVSIVGTTSAGGATSYPATVRIDNFDGLLPGMNADAEIVVEQAENILTIPSSAISRGNLVLVTSDSPSAANAVAQSAPEGYVYVKVETGVSDNDFTEIKSGLTKDDTVAYTEQSSASSIFTAIGAMSGMDFSGGMPSGGMGQSARSGATGGMGNRAGGNMVGGFSR